MHKTIIFLLYSLVITLPIDSNMNILSNSIADEDTNQYINNEDYLQRYEKFYKDDKFREAYYNYHKQRHHQEEQQQPLSHNDYYNYEADHHNNNKKYYATDPKNNIGIPYPSDENNNYEVKYSSNYESEYTEYTNETIISIDR